ncbi:disulfide bond formation protein B [Paenibacillus sambharensis]|uniref:Disulfide bond formation protein B n=1 Tax=Paenibacillus sambharensis TaxID=1803190 RepID=A0A2W1LRA6_9BACL|nr:disulfide oxidoreductase [Paenibacillus sambharensis]PZD97492.1 disulfide bond formation protein B [Paenibacillus sambharensis]
MHDKRVSTYLFGAWAVSVLATVGSLYLSEVMQFMPCSLCWFQRIFMYPLTILLGIASAKNSPLIIPYVIPLVVIGAAFSLYHTIIQKLPRNLDIAACGPVPCRGDYLDWFGFITIPMLALTAFLMILVALLRAQRLSR